MKPVLRQTSGKIHLRQTAGQVLLQQRSGLVTFSTRAGTITPPVVASLDFTRPENSQYINIIF